MYDRGKDRCFIFEFAYIVCFIYFCSKEIVICMYPFINHEEREKELKAEIERTKARMTPEELAKWKLQNKESEELANMALGFIFLIGCIFVALCIWLLW